MTSAAGNGEREGNAPGRPAQSGPGAQSTPRQESDDDNQPLMSEPEVESDEALDEVDGNRAPSPSPREGGAQPHGRPGGRGEHGPPGGVASWSRAGVAGMVTGGRGGHGHRAGVRAWSQRRQAWWHAAVTGWSRHGRR